MYEVLPQKEFANQIEGLSTKFDRLNQAIEMMYLVLQRQPQGRGFVVGRGDLRFIRTKPFRGVPELIVFFSIDEEKKHVYLVRVEQTTTNGSE